MYVVTYRNSNDILVQVIAEDDDELQDIINCCDVLGNDILDIEDDMIID